MQSRQVDGKPPKLKALKPVIQECLAKEPGGPDDWLEAVQLYNYGFKATARDLDSIEKTRPIALDGNDGHTMWVNSRGLKLLGVNRTPDRRAAMPAISPARPGLVVDGVGLVPRKELSSRSECRSRPLYLKICRPMALPR